MKLAFVTDLHVREDRIAEHTEALLGIAADIRAEGCSRLLIGGDICGRSVPHRASPAERNLVLRFILETKCEETIVVRGNHDDPEDWEWLNAVKGVSFVSGAWDLAGSSPSVVAIPWFDRTSFPEGAWESGVNAVWAAALASGADIAVGHCAYAGGEVAVGQPEVPTRDPVVSTDHQSASGIPLVLLGHYHRRQMIEIEDGMVAIYGGSTFVNEFGEDADKSWALIEWCPKTGDVSLEHLPVRCRRRVVLGVDTATDTVAWIKPENLQLGDWSLVGSKVDEAVGRLRGVGDFVRIQVSVASDREAAAAKEAVSTLQVRYGHEVSGRIEVEANHSMRDGAADVARESSLAGKIRVYAQSLAAPPRPVIVNRAIEILDGGVGSIASAEEV